MATATGPGIKSQMDVNSNPVVPVNGALSKTHVWSYIWFILAVLIILGFHVKLFGHPIPPSTHLG